MTQEEIDIMYMQRCLQLATNGLGRVTPNPLVGCVIVRDGKIISEGFHQEYGHNHAERNALLRLAPSTSDLRPPTSDLTLYVNLEPCSHYGKTPPCADLIIEKGIKRVVCCNDDPNPLVAGNGFRKLEEAGIEVVRHVLEEEGLELNRRFFTFMEKKRPYVILKWAESKDGFMAPKLSDISQSELKEQKESSNREISDSSFSYDCKTKKFWLSTQAQNRLNHRWRTEEAAILVGSETFLQDSPTLTPRHYLGPAPQPVVLDRRGRLLSQSERKEQKESSDSSLIKLARHTTFSSDCKKIKLSDREWLVLRSQTIPQVLQELYEHKLQSVIVEGGRQILDSFIASGLYDEVRILRSPQTLGSGLPAPEIPPIVPNRLIIID
jgi:diaminohydroxyphosphoribosylaminopyrimidine deaminase/5-amino-6-(5-phosphoribosylamino)uracil reductase